MSKQQNNNAKSKTFLRFLGKKKQWHIVKVQSVMYPTLRAVSSLNNIQNNEMKICEKYEVDMLKIIIIIIGYNLNNFTTHMTIL